MLRLHLLGHPQIIYRDKPVYELTSAKSQALLYYLAVWQRPVSRLALGSLLWADKSESAVRVNLRKALQHLQKALPDCLITTRETVALDMSLVETDVADFLAVVSSPTPLALEAQQDAAALYVGDFLAGFHLDDAPEFEQWQSNERQHLHTTAVALWEQITQYHFQRRHTVEALTAARRLLTLEPWREETHQQIMRLLASDGQIEAALAQFQTCQQLLKTELDLAPSAATEQLRQRIVALRQRPRPLLPTPLAPLVGRDSDVAKVCELVGTNSGRLVSIVGQGGMGKTRLALAVADRLAYAFLEGVFWIDLTETTTVADLPSSIAHQMNLPLHDQQEPLAELLAGLQAKECLLVLDNFEQLLVDTAVFTPLLAILEKCPTIHLLITSRHRLKLRHEAVFPLHPLTYPQTDLAEQLFAPRPYEAVQLFVQAAQRVNHHFGLEPEREAVHTICQLLEGLPLGVELAASLIDQQSGAEIAAALAHNLDALATEMADVPPRQRGLRAMFSYSWELLQAEERTMLAGLGIFWGEFTAATVLAVVGGSAESLARLRHQSLVRQHGEDDPYSLHETIRFYAQEQFARQPFAAQVEQNYTRYYLGKLGEQETALLGMEAKTAVSALQQQFANIVQAWHKAVARRQWPLLEGCLGAITRYAEVGGQSRGVLPLFTEAIAALEEAQAAGEAGYDGNLHGRVLIESGRALKRLGRPAEALPLVTAGVSRIDPASDPALLSHGELTCGEMLWHLGRYDEAEPHIERAMAHGRLANLPLIQLKGLRLTGNLLFVRGYHQQAQDHFAQAVAICRQQNWPIQTASCLNGLAATHYHLGEYDLARQGHEEALQLNRALGNELGMALSLGNLGDVYRQLGQLETAEQHYRDSLTLRQKVGDTMGEAWVIHALGVLYQQKGDWAQARAYYEQSLQLRQRTRDQREIAESHNSLAVLSRLEGRGTEAEQNHRQALAIYRALGDQFNVATTYYYLAQLAREQQDETAAREANEEALALFRQLGHEAGIAQCLAWELVDA